MGIKVVKFGGSSLSDAGQFAKVKAIIQSDPERRFVVPSAPGKRSYKDEKVTDMLYACHKAVSEGRDFADIFSVIAERYKGICSELHLAVGIDACLEQVREDIASGASADYTASRGEYLNGLVLADYLGFEFVDATDCIKFSKSGKYDEAATDAAVTKRLSRTERAVIPGFYGAMPDGSIKTFSRGGSDISGAIVARAVGATLYENWTDVSGFLMADPRIVNNPIPISVITYTELRELAYMGATVLHEESIFPVRQACIPINVKNTNAPDEKGTMIVPDGADYKPEYAITGIAGRKGFTVIAIEKDQMNTEVGFAAGVLSALAENGVSIEHMPTGIDTLSVIVEDKYIEGKRQNVIESIIKKCNPDSLELEEDFSLIAVVGRGMINKIGTSAKLFSALAMADVNVRMIDQGSSEINIIVGVDQEDFNTAVNAIYTAFAK